jgi:protein CpxP
MKLRTVSYALCTLALAAAAWAQPTPPAAPTPPPDQMPVPAMAPAPPVPPQPARARIMTSPVATTAPPAPPAPGRPPLERSLPGGRFWDNPEMAQRLGINSDQQKKMDDTFQQNRLRLVDLNATLQKEEIIMEPLMQADTPDENRILAQIDKVAQARAELEKANARFLLSIRRILTVDQWKKLQTDSPRVLRTPVARPALTAQPGVTAPPPPPAKKR